MTMPSQVQGRESFTSLHVPGLMDGLFGAKTNMFASLSVEVQVSVECSCNFAFLLLDMLAPAGRLSWMPSGRAAPTNAEPDL